MPAAFGNKIPPLIMITTNLSFGKDLIRASGSCVMNIQGLDLRLWLFISRYPTIWIGGEVVV